MEHMYIVTVKDLCLPSPLSSSIIFIHGPWLNSCCVSAEQGRSILATANLYKEEEEGEEEKEKEDEGEEEEEEEEEEEWW